MHLKSIPLCLYQHVYRIVSAGRVGHLAVLKTLPSKCSVRRGEERGLQRICSQISAPHSFHQQQLKDQNSVEIWHEVSEAKLGFSGVARIYASWRFSRGVDYSRWSQVWVLKPDPPGTHPSEPSCYQIFWTNLRALAKKVIDSLPFSIAPELITDTLWCAREQIWAEKICEDSVL